MKTIQLLITLVLFATLVPARDAKVAPALAVPEGTQAGDLPGKHEHAQAQATLKDLLDQEVKNQFILGMVMAVRLADGTVFWDTSGYIDPSEKGLWSANTVSHIASVSKTFTAVVVMQLVEEGKLSLDDTVDTWFPEQPNGDKITVRMLLSDTSGLANFSTIFGANEEKWTKEWAPEDLIAVANEARPVGKPGSKVAHYSNTNYIMLGLIIEKVAGNSWDHEVESRIIKPLGLKNTTFLKEGNWQEKVVPGYIKTSDGYASLLEYSWYPRASLKYMAVRDRRARGDSSTGLSSRRANDRDWLRSSATDLTDWTDFLFPS